MGKAILLTLKLLLAAAPLTTMAAPPAKQCDLAAARKQSQTAFAKKAYGEVLAALDTARENCSEQIYPPGGQPAEAVAQAYAWLISDAMLAAYKAGQIDRCLSEGVVMTEGFMSPFELVKDKKPGQAIMHNLELCSKDWLKEFTPVEAKPCALPKFAEKTGFEIPAAWLPKDLEAGCIILDDAFSGTPEELDAEAGPPADRWPGIVIAKKRRGAAAYEEEKLRVKSGGLATNADAACGLSNLRLLEKDGAKILNIAGSSGYCAGGSAAFISDGLYRWDGRELTLVKEWAATTH